ncbi:hypothetical protein COCC4DRAFT_160993 [Bipolaris maydis ATCC 48331]|uniref:Uncharacterized protein n=2 Tax=Cochliobolus heterostrophus TaxID=5016 RepID=M2SHB4_COCH5|nr:uncharacterized protein COCC4DRAFT_160993 [Bipolaris maydis ATCC 48331]EMD84775.1 hypothetical protein COCHEDRAFT_1208269 [Bipolaris maydis C5]ENI08556.1 hypothetical protein COCC4DRAFT_160993 [Bipolaris maydis ATCC 48331]
MYLLLCHLLLSAHTGRDHYKTRYIPTVTLDRQSLLRHCRRFFFFFPFYLFDTSLCFQRFVMLAFWHIHRWTSGVVLDINIFLHCTPNSFLSLCIPHILIPSPPSYTFYFLYFHNVYSEAVERLEQGHLHSLGECVFLQH